MFQRINQARTSTLALIAVPTGLLLGALIIWAVTAYLNANY
jgi:hypothetical protein